ncbi:uncharacterized protein A4U43_C03F31810 [Asparagus officinalis]|uniref:Uncharacterized protein n=1 Tax=Asparagus officinalis TaxID=4686 RepID=A0A5P1FEH5_ASPOF|nr:uncharacterized protein A4U43_C03F31810 [Asparagus officinalis]
MVNKPLSAKKFLKYLAASCSRGSSAKRGRTSSSFASISIPINEKSALDIAKISINCGLKEPSVEFEEAIAAERAATETAERQVAALETERATWGQNEGKLCRRVDIREDMIRGLQGHRTKQSATIAKLKEEIDHY